MAIKQTRDVLDYVRDFHKKLGDFYDDLADHQDKERIKMLLTYMARHEKYLEEMLDEYEKNASKKVMDSWLQCAPEMEMVDIFATVKLDPDMSVDDIISLAVKLDDYLIEVYRKVADSAELEEVKNIFTKLLEKENQEKYTLVRQAMRLNDL